MNGGLFFSMQDFPDQDLAIRRYCPARIEQEQGGGWDNNSNEIELTYSVSPTNHSIISSPQLATSEEEDLDLVDSFFNIDDYFDEERNNGPAETNKLSDHFQGEHGSFLLATDVYSDVQLMMDGEELEMLSSSSEENGAISEKMPNNAADKVSPGVVVDQGLQLVHLLLACAEAVGCRDTQLADSLLSQIWPWVSPWGDSLQRVTYCFAIGLKSRLLSLHNVNTNGRFTNRAMPMDVPVISREEKAEAFHLLHQTTPYITFGFMAANDAIFQAAQGKESLHIIDLGMEHTLQWPSLIRNLASRVEGPPKSIRITGIVGDQDLLGLENSMEGVICEASSLGIPLEFQKITESLTSLLLTRENLNLKEGETLFVNSIMHLHKHVKESRGSLKTTLHAIKKLGPTLLTVMEQDANHNGPFFLGRFLESLHYYSAIFDSLEASLPRNSPQRIKVEKFQFAEEILNIVACEGSERIERHERADQWRRQLGRAGFQGIGLKSMGQARMMLSAYCCDGYTLASEKGCLQLGWRGRPIMLASAWQVHNTTTS